MKKSNYSIKIRLSTLAILIVILTFIILGIILLLINNNKSSEITKNEIVQSQIEDTKNENFDNSFKLNKIIIYYNYGGLISFSDAYEENSLKIDVQGEQLVELKNILNNYNIESDEYKIEEEGHYHEETFYGGIIIIPAEYRIEFNDGSELLLDEKNYEIQYKNGNNYYLITDGADIAKEIIKIVDENLHKETVEINTDKISIKGLTSNNTIDIENYETISKILNEFRYTKSEVVTEELYETLIKYEKEDYEHKRNITRELEYKIDFNNGSIIKIILRNGNIGCISDENNNFIEGLKINSKFIFMIHNIITDYYREQNKILETDELYIEHNNINRKLSDSEKTEFLNRLCMIELDGDKIKETFKSSSQDYILQINNNKIVLNNDELYILYANGDSSYIYSLDLAEYIRNLIQ